MKHLAAIAAIALGAAATVAMPGTPAKAKENYGWIMKGLGNEDLAAATPCTPKELYGQLNGWETVGVVACFPKPVGATSWTLDYETLDRDTEDTCWWTYHEDLLHPLGEYGGTCLFTIDEGDHVKVWGASGVVWQPFDIIWH